MNAGEMSLITDDVKEIYETMKAIKGEGFAQAACAVSNGESAMRLLVMLDEGGITVDVAADFLAHILATYACLLANAIGADHDELLAASLSFSNKLGEHSRKLN